MRIAITYENGEVFQHFGHSSQLKFYNSENGSLTGSELINTNGQGHGAIVDILSANKADVLICGGIGTGAQTALAKAGIKLCAGITGSADEAAKAYIAGTLNYSETANCSSHEEHGAGHSCAEHGNNHSCSEHKCG